MTDFSERFETFVDIILAHEGGYVNDRDDPGGETNYGISKRQYPDLDITNLTVEQAKGIYYVDYYSHHMDNIYEPRAALMLFDFGVNAGVTRATRFMQEIVGAVPDGNLGPKTVNSINEYHFRHLIRDYGVRLALYYESLDNNKFLYGWYKRLFDNLTRGI